MELLKKAIQLIKLCNNIVPATDSDTIHNKYERENQKKLYKITFLISQSIRHFFCTLHSENHALNGIYFYIKIKIVDTSLSFHFFLLLSVFLFRLTSISSKSFFLFLCNNSGPMYIHSNIVIKSSHINLEYVY